MTCSWLRRHYGNQNYKHASGNSGSEVDPARKEPALVRRALCFTNLTFAPSVSQAGNDASPCSTQLLVNSASEAATANSDWEHDTRVTLKLLPIHRFNKTYGAGLGFDCGSPHLPPAPMGAFSRYPGTRCMAGPLAGSPFAGGPHRGTPPPIEPEEARSGWTWVHQTLSLWSKLRICPPNIEKKDVTGLKRVQMRPKIGWLKGAKGMVSKCPTNWSWEGESPAQPWAGNTSGSAGSC